MTLGKLTEEQIEEVLTNNSVGRIGCSDGQQTYVVPVTYVYDGRHIIAHSMYGMKIRIMRSNPSVCFEVDEIEHLGNWRSVIAWGWFEELRGAEADQALQLFVERIKPLLLAHATDYADATDQLNALNELRPMVYRIKLGKRTGRALSLAEL